VCPLTNHAHMSESTSSTPEHLEGRNYQEGVEGGVSHARTWMATAVELMASAPPRMIALGAVRPAEVTATAATPRIVSTTWEEGNTA
jgi:hypothetical protein